MREEYENIELVKNQSAQRFEMKVDDNLAFIIYRENNNKMTLTHTEVKPALRGRGAGTAIVEKTLDYIAKNNLKLIPICPFIVAYIRRHPKWKRILAKGVKNI